MTLRSRLKLGLVIVLVLFAAQSSFAQVNLSLIPDPNQGEILTNRNAQTTVADNTGAGILVSGQLIANSPLTATTLRIVYPSPITSAPATFVAGPVPTADPIRIEAASGLFASVTNGSVILNTSASRIE